MKQAIINALSAKEFNVVDVIAMSSTASMVASRPDDVHFTYGIVVGSIVYLGIYAFAWVLKKCLS